MLQLIVKSGPYRKDLSAHSGTRLGCLPPGSELPKACLPDWFNGAIHGVWIPDTGGLPLIRGQGKSAHAFDVDPLLAVGYVYTWQGRKGWFRDLGDAPFKSQGAALSPCLVSAHVAHVLRHDRGRGRRLKDFRYALGQYFHLKQPWYQVEEAIEAFEKEWDWSEVHRSLWETVEYERKRNGLT